MDEPQTPKYIEVANYIQRLIVQKALESDSPLPSELQLCRRFQCSRGTVRQAISVLEREGAVYRRQGAGMFVGRSYTPSKATQIAAIVPNVTTSELGRFVQLLGVVAMQRGYTLLLGVTNEMADVEQRFIEQVIQQRVVGVIKFPTDVLSEESLRERLRSAQVPYVVINDFWTDCRKDHHLAYDECVAVELAVAHLAGLGHRRIGLVDYANWTRNRIFDTFTRELKKRGLPVNGDSLLFSRGNHVPKVRELFAHGDAPTAFVTVYDVLALNLISELAQLDLVVPKDVSVVNLNGAPTVDMPFGLDLTTAVPPYAEMVAEALQLLTGELDARRIRHMVFAPEFHAGTTTATVSGGVKAAVAGPSGAPGEYGR